MTRALTATVVSSAAVIVTALLMGSSLLPALLLGLASAVGLWCAPLFAAPGMCGGTALGRWDSRWDGPKATQILAGGGAAAALILLRIMTPGPAVILGIAVAIGMGAVLSAPQGAASSKDDRSA